MAVPCVPTPFLSPSCPTALPEAPARPTTPDPERIKNLIPEPAVTEAPRGRQQPFDYEGEVYIGPEEGQTELLPEEEEEEEEEGGEENGLGPRGDVFGKPCSCSRPGRIH